MIFVILGTQDKSFPRLLEAIDEAKSEGKIKERIIVQAGCTKYESKNMEIFDYIPMDEFDKYIDDADIIITHGGVGSIVSSLKKNKKVLAVARLKKYDEHENDHQKQIINNFKEEGYLEELEDFSKLSEKIEVLKNKEYKKYSGNNEKMLKLVEEEIENTKKKFSYFRLLVLILLIFLIIYLVLSI